jgi:hypothetical protein
LAALDSTTVKFSLGSLVAASPQIGTWICWVPLAAVNVNVPVCVM